MSRVIVVGGGASGLMSAISAAAAGADVLILEAGTRCGKKILSTGGGRCNLSNKALDPRAYHGGSRKLAEMMTSLYGVKETLTFFDRIGIPTVTLPSLRGRDQYIYPKNMEAAAVREALELECDRLGIAIKTESKVISVKPEDGLFTVTTADNTAYESERVIIATGGKAAPRSGSDGSGYLLASGLGISCTDILPALCGLDCRDERIKRFSGVRTEAKVTLLINGRAAAEDTGEVQFTDYGVSGIPVFQISGQAGKALLGGADVRVRINLYPELTADKIGLMFIERIVRRPQAETGTLLLGMVPGKMVSSLMEQAEIPFHESCRSLEKKQLQQLAKVLQNQEFKVLAPHSFDNAQVTCGGIADEEITEHLESRQIPGLFFAGEILDVDGPCGGYNLQWAWTSGHFAGIAAAEERE